MNLPIPANMIEFDQQYRTESACRNVLLKARWPNGFRCPVCGHAKGHRLKCRPVIECAACGRQTSATAGTIFHSANLPLTTLFKLIYLIVAEKSGTNMSALSRQCGVNYRTAMLWARKVRAAMIGRESTPLRGKVEIDETMIGGPAPGHPGRDLGPNQAWVLVMVEDIGNKCGRLRLEAADTASGEELCDLIAENVEDGSDVVTDGWEGYGSLEARGYAHTTKVAKTQKDASVELPLVHRVASLLKRFINGVLHGSWTRTWLRWMLEEFVFRFNRRRSLCRPLLFNRVLETGVLRRFTTRVWLQNYSRFARGLAAA